MPKTDKLTFTTSLPVELLKQFREHCRRSEYYQNEIIEKLIRDFLKKEKEKVKVGGRNGIDNS